MEEAGDWDLDGLFVRLGAAIDAVGAKRVVIDTIETLFGAFSNTASFAPSCAACSAGSRSGACTAVITGERGDGTLTRHGIEEYVSDCVIVLDHRVTEQTSTRRLRILKYRGSLHGTNEYPFLIGESGVSVLPITSLGLQHSVSASGCRRAWPASTPCSATAASTRGARSSSAAPPAPASRRWRRSSATPRAAAANGPCTSPSRSPRRRSSGTWRRSGSTCGNGSTPACCSSAASARASSASRPTSSPCRSRSASSIRPWSSWTRSPTSCASGRGADVSAMLTRQVDFLKARGVTALFTSLNSDAEPTQADQQIASLVDTWLLVKTMEGNGEHNRVLYVLKSRGMAHSNQIREFLLTEPGHRAGRRLRRPAGRAHRLGAPGPGGQGALRRDGAASRTSSSAGSTWSGAAKRSRPRPRRCGASSRTRPTSCRRLLSHGSTGVEDRAGQRAEQGRLRRADTDEPSVAR